MTDTETTGLREMFILHGSQEEGPQPAMQDHTEKHQEAEGVRGCMHGQSQCCGFHGEEGVRQDG